MTWSWTKLCGGDERGGALRASVLALASAMALLTACAAGTGGSRCIDEDGDGFGSGCGSGLDCDDADPSRHAGAVELCDGVDQSCDGAIDEGCECTEGESRTCGLDRGACAPGAQVCRGGVWSACEGAGEPGEETCDGALDEDCDGVVDESCACAEGATRPCGVTVGACEAGAQTCRDGAWAACEGAAGPGDERCDGAGDEDCDGAVDEGCECSEGTTRACGSDTGACEVGSQRCVGASWSACEGAVGPVAERCEGSIDDDCDGRVDEGCACVDGTSRSCGVETGECSGGTQRCAGGAYGACEGAVGPVAERCDGGADEDCDGRVDEGCACVDGAARSCGSDVGECRPGSSRCTGGAWGACAGAIGPRAESCDGSRDEDCDGRVDEGCACTDGARRPCGSDVGRCSAGSQSCASGGWGACTGAVGPIAEVCDGSVDEDCDGMVDEGCSCTNGATRACGIDVGECRLGSTRCSGGAWGACTGAVGPGTESCDGSRDEDCDGRVDEGCACTNGARRACGSDVGRCSAGTQSCASGAWGACTGAVGPVAEVCDGSVDDDCDGRVDEGCACTNGATRPCGSDVGACVPGRETCASGMWGGTCAMAVGPELERCGNEIDDDCDGTADEGCPCPLLTVACASGCCDVPDVPVATGVTPSIATDADGRVFVAYVSSSRETRLATFDPATATWSDQLMGSWSARPVVRVGPDGRVHVLFVESSSYLGIVTAYPEYRVSSDHGRTWTADDPYGPEGEGLNGDLALDATGRAHVVLSDTRRTVYFVRDGSRWTAGAPEAGGRTSLRLAVDTFSRPRVIYLEPMGGSPVLRHAYFDGAAWRYETIDATGPFGSVSDAHGRHDLAIGADGNSEVLYVRGTRAGGHSLIYAVRSAAGAWTSTETPATGGDIANARLARASSGAPLAIADGLALLESRPGPWARTAIPVTGFHAAVARRRSDLLVAFNTTYAGGSLRLTRLRR